MSKMQDIKNFNNLKSQQQKIVEIKLSWLKFSKNIL
jgi:hypothetical protein